MDWDRHSEKDAHFNFGHIQPGGMNGRVVNFQALCDLSGDGRVKGFIERSNGVNIQIYQARRKILCKRFSTKSRKLALQKRSSLPAESLASSIPPHPGRYARRWRRECRPGGGGS